jgi:DNA-binding NtrC family response regulator
MSTPQLNTSTEEKQLHVRIPIEFYRKLKVKCTYADESIQDYVVRLIADSLGENSVEGGSLLIIEDEAVLRESLRDWLCTAHRVQVAATGEEASELISKEDFDIVITDVRLPGKSGLDLVRELKATKPYVKCVVITAYPSVELAVEAMKEGAIDYLAKPIDPDRLEDLIQRILAMRKTNKG